MNEKFLGAEFWRHHVEKFAQSGLSQAAYCREQGLILSRFGYWHRKLKASQTSSWLPVEIKPPPADASSIDLVLAETRVLNIKSGFDALLLKQIVLAVESLP